MPKDSNTFGVLLFAEYFIIVVLFSSVVTIGILSKTQIGRADAAYPP